MIREVFPLKRETQKRTIIAIGTVYQDIRGSVNETTTVAITM